MQPGQRQNNQIKHNIYEYIDKIREEVTSLHHEIQGLKNERDKLIIERTEFQKCASLNHELFNTDLLSLNETVKNLTNLINQFSPLLSHENQQNVSNLMEKIKMQHQRKPQIRAQPKMPFVPQSMPVINPLQLAAMFGISHQGMNENQISTITSNRNSNFNNMFPLFMNMQNRINQDESDVNSSQRKRRDQNCDEPDGRASVETRPSEEMPGNGIKSPIRDKVINRSISNNSKIPRQIDNEMYMRNFCLPYGMINPSSMVLEEDLRALGVMPNMRSEMIDYKNITKNAVCNHIVNDSQPILVKHTMEHSSGVPKNAKAVSILPQDEVVCAVALNSNLNLAYTGGKGRIRGWNISNLCGNKLPIMSFDCLNGAYVRSTKLTKDGRTIIVGGEEDTVSIFDFGNGSVQKRSDLKNGINACYSIGITNDDKMCYVCCADGNVGVWDLHNSTRIRQFKAHSDGATSIAISPDDSLIWTGGLDKCVCTWDIRGDKLVKKYPFTSSIYSLSNSPDWLAIGMENASIECLNLNQNEKYQLLLHNTCVLSINFSHSYRWMVSTGKDQYVNGWASPMGPNMFQLRESASVLCSEISANDDYLVVGCGDNKAIIYEIY